MSNTIISSLKSPRFEIRIAGAGGQGIILAGIMLAEAGITQKSPAEIRKLLKRRFDVNDVEHVGKNDVKIKKEGGILRVTVDYEVRVPIMWNVDAVTKFSKEIEVGRH